MKRTCLALLLLLLASPSLAQTASQPPSRLARWIDLQTVNLQARYRGIEDSDGEVTANQLQERTQLRWRVTFDAERRYALNFGVFTGSSFTGSWNATGIGSGRGSATHLLKQLFMSAVPADGVELQYGSLYLARGQSSEITTYDTDGYVSGARLSLRRPEHLFFNDVTVTAGSLGAFGSPALTDRWNQFEEVNYGQVQVSKRLSPHVAASFDYTRVDDLNFWRPAAIIDASESGLVDEIQLEFYFRDGPDPAQGLSVAAAKEISRWLEVGGGYVDVDPDYGNLNGDRYFSGKRVVLNLGVPVTPEFTVSVYATHSVGSNPYIPVKTRLDVVAGYNLVPIIRRTGLF